MNMQRLFKNISSLSRYADGSYINFPIQLAENREAVLVRALAPGLRQDDLNIVLAGQTLSISGRIACHSGRYLRQECPCGSFRRDINLGCRVDSASVKAELKAGVLTITLPKHKSAKPCRIKVEYGG